MGRAWYAQSEIQSANPQSERAMVGARAFGHPGTLRARGRSRVVADRGAGTGAVPISSAHDATAATVAAARWARPSWTGCRTSDAALTTLITAGLPSKGMPGIALTAPDLRDLLPFLRTLSAPDARCAAACPRRDGRRRHTRRRRAEPVVDRPATALRRRTAPPAAALGPSVSGASAPTSTGPAITARRPATGSVRWIRSAAATSRGWHRPGCSRCLAPNACR